MKVYVHLDGEPVPRWSRGEDCQEDALGRTFVTVGEPRIYKIISECVPPTPSHGLVGLADY